MICGSIGAGRAWRRPLGAAAGLCVVTAAAGLSQSASAQFVEAGPSTSLSTVPSAPNNLNSNTLVTGMASGDPAYGAANLILQSPTDPSTYWAATVSGGVWKTTNGGATWTPTTDSQPALEIGAIALDAADPNGKTLYAGTGAYSAGGLFGAFSPHTTLLKSTDGGVDWKSWTPTGIQNLYDGLQYTDPSPASVKGLWVDGQTVLVSAGSSWGSASFFNAGGLYRSTDGGQTFSLVPGFNTEVSSLVATSVSNQTVLVAARNGYAYHNASGVLYSVDQSASLADRSRQHDAADKGLEPDGLSIPGFGPITASAMAATVQDTSGFAGPREFAAFLGLTPKQSSSGGKQKLGRISKMGNRYLRKLLVVGAHAVLFHRKPHTDPLRMWAKKLIEKKPFKLVAVALANKMARIAFAILRGKTVYREIPA